MATQAELDTKLRYAVDKGEFEYVASLLEQGADIECETLSGRTPLIIAATNNYREIVDLLLTKQANLNTRDYTGCSALLYAAEQGNQKIVRALLIKGAESNRHNQWGLNALMHAAMRGDLDIAADLLEHGARINFSAGSEGKTALYYAVIHNRIEMIKFLVEKGADIDAKDQMGKTVLKHAEENQKEEAIAIIKSINEQRALDAVIPIQQENNLHVLKF